MRTFKIGISAKLYRADGSSVMPEIDFSALTNNPRITVSVLPDVDTGQLIAAHLAHLDAAILFLERIGGESFCPESKLTVLARYGVGYDTIDIPACTAAGVGVAIAPSGVRRPVATAVIGMLLSLTLNLKVKDRITRDIPKGWETKTSYNGMGLVGRTLGGIGVGNIGAEVFRLIKPFDMRLIAHDPHIDGALAESLGVELVPLDEVFRQSDVVTVNCLLDDTTHHLVNESRLAMMKQGSYLINTSRGPVIDEDALIIALERGQIAGAGLDVFELEPPDKDNPLLSMENVILSPHALCFTDQCIAGIGEADVNVCLSVMRGELPDALVNTGVLQSARFNEALAVYRGIFAYS